MEKGTKHSAESRLKMSETRLRFFANGGIHGKKGVPRNPEAIAKHKETARINREIIQNYWKEQQEKAQNLSFE